MTRPDLESLRELVRDMERDLGAWLDAGQLDGDRGLHIDARDAHAAIISLRFACQDRLEDLAEGEAA